MNLEEAFSGDGLTLIGYLPAGYPNEKGYRECVKILADAGFQVLEIGIPYEMANMDGEIIDKAMKVVLKRGVDIVSAIKLGSEAAKGFDMAAVGMLYYSIFSRIGVDECLELFSEAGVEGILVPDVPPEMLEAFSAKVRDRGITPVGFVPLDADMDRIKSIVREAEGFLYCQSYSGKTGEAFEPSYGLKARLVGIKNLAGGRKLPIAVGFGIRGKGDLDEVRAMGGDGAIIGSAIVEAAGEGELSLKRFVGSLRQKMPSGRG
jgi:tryptophan synthase alpha chain